MLASMQQRRSAPLPLDKITTAPDMPVDPPDTQASFWLDAYHDPVASLKAFSTCLHTCDLFGDGDWRLAVAGIDKKLKVRV